MRYTVVVRRDKQYVVMVVSHEAAIWVPCSVGPWPPPLFFAADAICPYLAPCHNYHRFGWRLGLGKRVRVQDAVGRRGSGSKSCGGWGKHRL